MNHILGWLALNALLLGLQLVAVGVGAGLWLGASALGVPESGLRLLSIPIAVAAILSSWWIGARSFALLNRRKTP